ncbi:MAG: hypothetical protein JWR61_4341 [Ferruginibacter sp.]|nr:hypothetical protein [Ferruginibacter sp.]
MYVFNKILDLTFYLFFELFFGAVDFYERGIVGKWKT